MKHETLRDYDKEGNIEVYRADDCIDCNGDCDGIGSYELRWHVVTLNIKD